MHQERSLIYAYLLDGEGGADKMSWTQVENWDSGQGVLWVHLNYTTKRSKHWLRAHSGLDKISSHGMLSDDPRPRAIFSKHGILVTLRGVNLNTGQDSEDMVSLRIWIDKNRIITTERRNLLSICDIKCELESSNGPENPAEFLSMLNHHLLERIGDVVDDIDVQVDSLEGSVMSDESYLLRPKLSDLRRKAIAIRRYLSPQREALYRLNTEKSQLIDEENRLHLRESTDRTIRYIEDLDESRERIIITQEELSSKLSEQLNTRIFLLSVVAIIFLPLSFITGLLGINVDGIPGAKNPWGFSIVCGFLIVIFMSLWWVFRKRKWI